MSVTLAIKASKEKKTHFPLMKKSDSLNFEARNRKEPCAARLL